MIETLRRVHVEASSRCNSKCPMCSRYTATGYVQPGLELEDLKPEIFHKLFTPERCKDIDHVYFSGVYGDPCLNKALPEFVKHLKDHYVDVAIDTNAGYRNPEWWARLGANGTRVHFAIDGLEDTNHLYRRGVVWDKLIANVKAFQEAGGNGAWTFIAFKHNEHQVEEARAMAKELGMDFRLKVTQKFRQANYAVMENGEFQYDLFPPDIPELRHSNVGTGEHRPKEDFFEFRMSNPNYKSLDDVTIDCSIKKREELYLTHTGHLLPCCFLGTMHHDSPGAFQFKNYFDLSIVDLSTVSVDEAINNLRTIEETWDLPSIEEGKLLTCARTCGKTLNNQVNYVK